MKKMFAVRASNWIYNWIRSAIRHPQYRWWIILGSFIYLLSPIDILPDVLPVVGWIDDGLLATIVVTEVSKLMNDRLKAQKHKTVIQTSDVQLDAENVIDVEVVSIG